MKELHLAENITALNNLAQKSLKNFRPDKLYVSAEKLFKSGLESQNEGDEETAYIYYHRFILVYEFLLNSDKHFTNVRLKSEYGTVTNEIDKLRNSLINRYSEIKLKKTSIIEEPSTPVDMPEKSNMKFPSKYVTCSELHNLVKSKVEMVLFDTRPVSDFRKSSMKLPNAVNIPEEIIQSGKSANILGQDISNESKDEWDKRWTVKLIILFDWSSTKETLVASKVSVLKDILLQWDTTISDNTTVLILSGGYLEWLQTYPMLCTNPNIVYEVQNDVLNDLLDLDSIEYPAAEEATRYLRPPSLLPVVNRATKPIINQLNINTNTNEEIISYDTSKDIENVVYIDDSSSSEPDNDSTQEQTTPENTTAEIPIPNRDLKPNEKNKPQVNKENEQIRKKYTKKNGENKKPLTINNNIINDPTKISNGKRDLILKEARQLKKKINNTDSLKNLPEFKKGTEIFPHIDRDSKPGSKKRPFPQGCTGLDNLGSTCYMNSVLQILSHTRMIHNFFRLDNNPHPNINGPVSGQFKELLDLLWSGEYSSIRPIEFKNMVDKYGPRFHGSEHQDAQEFMITFNWWLHEDLKVDIVRPIQCVWTPKEEAWIEETGGKISIVSNTFMGQNIVHISCNKCKKRMRKFEIFQTLALALPVNNCTLQQCLELYTEQQPIVGYTCSKCSCSKSGFINHEIASLPPNLVITLKRFLITKGRNGYMEFRKNSVAVDYPIENLNVGGNIYNLYGIVVHTGTLTHGHYYAFIKHLYTGIWYIFNDNQVRPVTKKALIEPNNAYMLFYTSEEEERKTQKQFKRN